MSSYHLSKYTSQTPVIHTGRVELGAQQDLRSPIPQGNNFVSVGPHWDTKGPSQPKICQLDQPSRVDQKILRFEISVKHSVSVAVTYSLQQLSHVGPNKWLWQTTSCSSLSFC